MLVAIMVEQGPGSSLPYQALTSQLLNDRKDLERRDGKKKKKGVGVLQEFQAVIIYQKFGNILMF